MKLTLDNLLSFHTVATEGSFSSSARKLGKSQSTVSGAVKNLEQELGYLLLDRSTQHIRLTAKGKRIYSLTTPFLSKYYELCSAAQYLTKSEHTKIKVGIDSLVFNSKVKRVLIEFSEEFPEVEINVLTKPSHILGDYINRQQVDIAICNPYHKTICDFNIDELFSVNCHWVANKNLLSTPYFDIGKSRLLLLDGYKDVVELSHISSHNVWVLDDISVIADLCIAGKGVAFLPHHIIEKYEDSAVLSPIPSDSNLFGKQIYASMLWPLHTEFGKYHQWIHNKLRVSY